MSKQSYTTLAGEWILHSKTNQPTKSARHILNCFQRNVVGYPKGFKQPRRVKSATNVDELYHLHVKGTK